MCCHGVLAPPLLRRGPLLCEYRLSLFISCVSLSIVSEQGLVGFATGIPTSRLCRTCCTHQLERSYHPKHSARHSSIQGIAIPRTHARCLYYT